MRISELICFIETRDNAFLPVMEFVKRIVNVTDRELTVSECYELAWALFSTLQTKLTQRYHADGLAAWKRLETDTVLHDFLRTELAKTANSLKLTNKLLELNECLAMTPPIIRFLSHYNFGCEQACDVLIQLHKMGMNPIGLLDYIQSLKQPNETIENKYIPVLKRLHKMNILFNEQNDPDQRIINLLKKFDPDVDDLMHALEIMWEAKRLNATAINYLMLFPNSNPVSLARNYIPQGSVPLPEETYLSNQHLLFPNVIDPQKPAYEITMEPSANILQCG